VDRCLPLDGGDGFEEGDVLGADFHAVAGLTAVGNAAFFHHHFQPLFLQRLAGGVIVEEAHLADDGGADVLVGRRVLRARFEAASAADAARQRITLFLQFLRDRRARADVVRAVDRHPGLHALEVIEQPHQVLCAIMIDAKEVLIPIHENSLEKIDKKNRRLFVNLPDGLLDIYINA